jgi:hypothetical protein
MAGIMQSGAEIVETSSAVKYGISIGWNGCVENGVL